MPCATEHKTQGLRLLAAALATKPWPIAFVLEHQNETAPEDYHRNMSISMFVAVIAFALRPYRMMFLRHVCNLMVIFWTAANMYLDARFIA